MTVKGDFTKQSGYFAMQQLLPRKPDVGFAASDTMAWPTEMAIRSSSGLAQP